MLKHIVIILFFSGAYLLWDSRPITYGHGVVAPNSPSITYLLWEQPFSHKNLLVTPVRRIEGEMRVLSKNWYLLDDKADIVPYDLVLGWGDMSDEKVIGNIKVSQRNRNYRMEMTRHPIPPKQIGEQSTMIHALPSSKMIQDELNKVRRGNIITIKGYIVDVKSKDESWFWKSDFRNESLGDRDSQIVWIEEISIQ